MKRVKTSIYLDQDLWQEFKRMAKYRGSTTCNELENALRGWLLVLKKKEEATKSGSLPFILHQHITYLGKPRSRYKAFIAAKEGPATVAGKGYKSRKDLDLIIRRYKKHKAIKSMLALLEDQYDEYDYHSKLKYASCLFAGINLDAYGNIQHLICTRNLRRYIRITLDICKSCDKWRGI